MVGTGHPERTETAHALIANEDIFNREHECMAHVESTGNVWRWKHDGIGWRVRSGDAPPHAFVRVKESALLPRGIDARLGRRWVVGLQEFLGHCL